MQQVSVDTHLRQRMQFKVSMPLLVQDYVLYFVRRRLTKNGFSMEGRGWG